MKAGWEVKTLGDIAEIKGGKRLPKGYKLQSEITNHPYITVSDFNDNGTIDFENIRYISDEVFKTISRYIISSDDLYISIAGTIGKTGIISEQLNGANLTENACKLVFKSGIDKRFIYFFTKSHDFLKQTEINTRTTTQPKLALERLKTISLQIPPLPEQQRIVALLDAAFASIATAKANTEQNLKNARALFDSYLHEVFSKRGKGWEEKTLGDVCEFLNGFAFKSSNVIPKSKTQLVRMGNLYGHKLDLERNPVFYPDTFSIDYKKYTLKEDDLIISLTGTVGKEDYGYTVRVPKSEYKLLLNQRIAKFDAIKENLINKDYLEHYLRSRNFLDILYSTANGTRQANLSTVVIKTLPIFLPSLLQQKIIVDKLNILKKETQRLETIYQRKLQALDELKKSLLHQAFSGLL